MAEKKGSVKNNAVKSLKVETVNKTKKSNFSLKVAGSIVGVVMLVLLFASFQSNDYRIERAIIITAPTSAIFANVNDFHRWQAWSPWEKLDPAMKRTFEGPQAGTGSIYHWIGNDKVGEGSMTVTESRSKEFIRIKTDLLKPTPETTVTEVTFKDNGDHTVYVNWVQSGHLTYTTKLINLFSDMDKEIGTDLQNGLERLKWATQGPPAA